MKHIASWMLDGGHVVKFVNVNSSASLLATL
jgi:hypothetical protein